MATKSYKTKFAEPLIKQLKSLVKTGMVRYFQALDNYERLNQANGKLYRDNEWLRGSNEKLSTENSQLKGNIKDYMLLRKVFGNKQIDSLLEQARTTQKFKERDKHFRSNN